MKSTPERDRVTDHRALDGALARGIGVVAAFAALAGAARVGQDAVIAWRFGTTPVVDAYYLLLNVATWPISVALALLSVLIAPVDARLRSIDPVALRRFRGELLGTALVIAGCSLPLAWWGLRTIAGSDLGGLDAAAAALAGAGSIRLAPMVSLGIVGALMSAWLIAANRKVLTLLEGIPSLVLLVLLLVLPSTDLFLGTSIGFAVQVLCMTLVLRRAGELPRALLGQSGEYWQRFSEGAVVLLASQVLFALFPLMDSLFAARLGEGAVASVSYANRLTLGLQGLAGLALQRSGLPLLSSLSVHSPGATRAAALRWAVAMAGLGTVGAIVVALQSDLLVSLLFERGNFTVADRMQCATLLRYGMLQMPFFLGAMALVTALASMSARRALAAVAFVNIAVKLLSNVLLVPWLGAAGLMVATAVMYATAATTAWIALRHQFRAAPS